jgi:exopolysaccharide production protein ExoQ
MSTQSASLARAPIGPSADPVALFSNARLGIGTDPVGWVVCFLSFECLLLDQWVAAIPAAGTIMILLFMVPWLAIIARRPRAVFHGIVENWPLLAFPLLAVASTLWSDYPDWTFRAGLQLCATIVIGIIAGTCLRPQLTISALLSALALTAILSILFGRGGGGALVGVFGSKNYFAVCMSVLLLTSGCVTLDKSQPRYFRILGLIFLCLTPLLLFYARSAGAIVCSAATGALMAVMYGILFFHPNVRAKAFCLVVFVCATLAVLGALYADEFPSLLQYMGKDVTLTGRTYLWQRAILSFTERPLFGLGYQAFWQIGNNYAEELWAYEHVGRGGFNFHDLYLQLMVDLGTAGLLTMVIMFIVIIFRIAWAVLSSPRSEQLFAMTMFIFLLLRSPVEVDYTFQFQIASVLLCLQWIYLRRASWNPGA